MSFLIQPQILQQAIHVFSQEDQTHLCLQCLLQSTSPRAFQPTLALTGCFLPLAPVSPPASPFPIVWGFPSPSWAGLQSSSSFCLPVGLLPHFGGAHPLTTNRGAVKEQAFITGAVNFARLLSYTWHFGWVWHSEWSLIPSARWRCSLAVPSSGAAVGSGATLVPKLLYVTLSPLRKLSGPSLYADCY